MRVVSTLFQLEEDTLIEMVELALSGMLWHCILFMAC